jgi:hypothetical protein
MRLGISAYYDTALLDSRIVSTWLALYVVLHLLTMIIHEGHLLTYYSSWTSPLHTRIIVARFIPIERIRHQSDQTQQSPSATSKAEDTDPYEPGMLVHVQREQYYRRTAGLLNIRRSKATVATIAEEDRPAKRIVVEGSEVYSEHVDINVWQKIWFHFADPFRARFTGARVWPHFYLLGWTMAPFGGNRHVLYPKPFADESKGALKESQGGNKLQHGQKVTVAEIRPSQISVAQMVFAVLDSEPVPPDSSMNENCTRLSFPELFDHANGASYPSRVHLSGADTEMHMGKYEHMIDMKGPSPVYKKKTSNSTSSSSCLFAHSARWYVAEITVEDLERAKNNHRKLFISAKIAGTILFQSKQAPRRWLSRRALPLPMGDDQDWKTGREDDVPCFRISANIQIETRHSVDVPFDSYFQLDFPPEYTVARKIQCAKATISYVSGSYEYKEDIRMYPSPEPTRIDNWIHMLRSASFDNPKYTQRKRCSVDAEGGNEEVHWCTCTGCAQLETVAIVSGEYKFRTGKLQGGSLNGTNGSNDLSPLIHLLIYTLINSNSQAVTVWWCLMMAWRSQYAIKIFSVLGHSNQSQSQKAQIS